MLASNIILSESLLISERVTTIQAPIPGTPHTEHDDVCTCHSSAHLGGENKSKVFLYRDEGVGKYPLQK